MGKVVSVNISESKGIAKKDVGQAMLLPDLGVEGDAHSGPGIRQVSLLARESIREFEKNPQVKECLKNGAFGENITTEGIVLNELSIGDKLEIGEAVIEVSKIGKECLKPCAIMKAVGNCIMPKQGIFAIVLKRGLVRIGDRIDKIQSI